MGTITKTILLLAVLALYAAAAGNERDLLGLVGIEDEDSVAGLVQVFRAVAWFAAALLLNLFIRVALWDGVVKRAIGHPVPVLLVQMSNVTVLFITTLLVVRSVFGASIVGFLTALGAVSVVVAFGLRGLVSDLFTGLAINVEQPFQIGDWIAFYDTQGGRHVGQVKQINWRTTHLVAETQNYLVIPNREIGDSTLINYWRPKRANRFELSVTLDYAVAVEEARRILMAAVSAVHNRPGFVADMAPQVLVEELDEDGVKYRLRYWIKPWDGTSPSLSRDTVQSSVLKHLRLAGITPAYSKLEHFEERKPEVLEAGQRGPESARQMLGLMEFFSPLNPDELDRVVAQSQTESWSHGQTLLEQGQQGASMFVVLQGLLEVWLESDQGEAIRVGQIEAGEFFGEMSLLTGAPRGATIRAATEALTLEITKPVMQELLADRPALGERISELVARRQLATQAATDQHASRQSAVDPKNAAAQIFSRIRAFLSPS